MALRFAGGTDKVTLALGNLGFAFGPGTLAVVWRTSTLASQQELMCIGTGTTCVRLGFNTSGQPYLFCDAASSTETTVAFTTNTWYLLVATKATGSVAPRFFLKTALSAGTGTWVNGGTAIANSSVPPTQAQFGINPAATVPLIGDLALAAVWDVALTDLQMASLHQGMDAVNWGSYVKPRGIWLPNVGTITDLSGGGANESSRSGTSACPDEMPMLALASSRYRRPEATSGG